MSPSRTGSSKTDHQQHWNSESEWTRGSEPAVQVSATGPVGSTYSGPHLKPLFTHSRRPQPLLKERSAIPATRALRQGGTDNRAFLVSLICLCLRDNLE